MHTNTFSCVHLHVSCLHLASWTTQVLMQPRWLQLAWEGLGKP